jgi:uncharacterized membrane protein HdeD (DUF308 family)
MEPHAPTDPAAPSYRHLAGVSIDSSAPRRRGIPTALGGNWSLVLLRGVVAILFALVAFVWPGATMVSLVVLFSAYMLVDGCFAIASGVRAARAHERWGWFAVEGIADIVTAVVAFLWPSITILAFVLLAAAWALVSGVVMLVAAFRLGTHRGRPWLIVAGVVSIVWGLLLIVAPVAGAIAMTWWLGAYALAFGLAMVAAAVRLRRELHEPVAHDASLGGAV